VGAAFQEEEAVVEGAGFCAGRQPRWCLLWRRLGPDGGGGGREAEEVMGWFVAEQELCDSGSSNGLSVGLFHIVVAFLRECLDCDGWCTQNWCM
jgi:hypothetical protein